MGLAEIARQLPQVGRGADRFDLRHVGVFEACREEGGDRAAFTTCPTPRRETSRPLPSTSKPAFSPGSGQCVLNRSCDASRRTCDALPPACLDGQLPSIDDSGCWGPCLAPSECREVTSCADCANDLCVEFEGPRITARCRARNVPCEQGSYCQCLQPCGNGSFSCSENGDRISCTCLTCG